MKLRKILVLPLLLVMVGTPTFLVMGCKTQAYQIHPGSPNVFDSQAYDILVTTDAAIKQTKQELAAGSFPANLVRGITIALNDVIRGYDIANVSYQAYHKAATATPPTATVAMQNDLQAKTSVLPGLVSNLQTAKGK